VITIEAILLWTKITVVVIVALLLGGDIHDRLAQLAREAKGLHSAASYSSCDSWTMRNP
jgi:hypothetical protein